VTFLVERLGELRKHLAHLRALERRVKGAQDLRQDLSLHNDVLFSLLTVCQLVIDIASELSTRRGLKIDDYTEAVRNLGAYTEFPPEVLETLSRLPGFRNVVVREYVNLDLDRAVEALRHLDPVEKFARIVGEIEGRG
jgi:uncharacterized protein YutE (UPF0331/DUF86 family)